MLHTIDDELQNRWFDFGGDTVINTNRHIRLTSKNLQAQQGYLWSRLVTFIRLNASYYQTYSHRLTTAFDIIKL